MVAALVTQQAPRFPRWQVFPKDPVSRAGILSKRARRANGALSYLKFPALPVSRFALTAPHQLPQLAINYLR
jgi:hypothetical protein